MRQNSLERLVLRSNLRPLIGRRGEAHDISLHLFPMGVWEFVVVWGDSRVWGLSRGLYYCCENRP